jgi:hypothetical protein
MQRLILTDADGVLLNWEYAFDCWMQEHGFVRKTMLDYDICVRYEIEWEQGKTLIKRFNESAAIGFLPPLRDAMYYVKKLHEEHGYIFHVITSLSTNMYAKKLREKNLDKLFGTAISEVTCLATGADKHEALEPYRDSGLFWFEDKEENAVLGHEMGLKSYLVEHGHNMDHKVVPIVKNWKEIYDIVVASEVGV